MNPSDKKALQDMWDESKAPGSVDLSDGKYEFIIVKAKAVLSEKVTAIKQTLLISGGHSDYVGEHVDVWDTLETKQNMDWFKKKCATLGITIPKKVEVLFADSDTDGSVCQQMLGKKFAGAAVTNDRDYVNIYVNRFIEDVDLSEIEGAEDNGHEEDNDRAGSGHEDAPDHETPPDEPTEIEEGDIVTFTLKGKEVEGKVLALVKGGKAMVKTDKGTYKVLKEKLSIVYDDDGDSAEPEPEAEDAEPEAEGDDKGGKDGPGKFPDAAAIGSMRMPAIRNMLKDHGFVVSDVAQPREFAAACAGFLYEKKYAPEVSQLKTLQFMFGVNKKKGDKPAALVKDLAAAVKDHFN